MDCGPHKVSTILSYCGNVKDIGINYSLLVVNIAAVARNHVQIGRVQQDGGEEGADSSRSRRHHHAVAGMLLSLGFAIAFQISLCIVDGCVGISIIWCAILGWLVIEYRRTIRQQQSQRRHAMSCGYDLLLVSIAILVDVLAIGFYAIVATPITTVAHLLAIVLGIVLETISRFCSNCKRNIGDDNGAGGINSDVSTPLVGNAQ